MAFEAYRIAVRLSLVENVTAGLSRLSANFARAGMDATALQKRLDKIAKTTLVGTALTASGGFLLKALQAPLDEAKRFQTEQAKFESLGLGDKALDDATKFAKSLHVAGNSARDALRMLRETTTIMGSLEHAKEVTPLLLTSRFAIRSYLGAEKGDTFEKQFQDAIKTTELRGAIVNRETGKIDPENFRRVYNLMGKSYFASGGLVKPSDYLAMIKTGGVSAKMQSDESFFAGMGHFMQESGGSRMGTAMMSAFQNWIMGRMPQRIAEDMAKVGLLQKSAIHYGKTGHITRVDIEGLLRAKEFIEFPFKYMNEVAKPLLEKQGFKGDNLNLKLASFFGIRTAANLSDQMVREELVAKNYIERFKLASNWEQMANIGGKTLQGKEIALEANWQTLMLELGEKILPLAIVGVEKLNRGIEDLTAFAKEHPVLTKFAMVGTGVVGALAALGGTLLLVKAAFMGLSPILMVLLKSLVRFPALLGGGTGLTGMLAGAAAAIVGGAGLGIALGFLIYKLGEGTEAMNTFGSWVTIVMAKLGNKDAQAALDADERYQRAQRGVRLSPTALMRLNDPRLAALGADFHRPRFGDVVPPGGKSQPVQVTSVVKLNEREIARAVTTHQTKEAQKPQSGTSWFSSGRMPPPVNFSY